MLNDYLNKVASFYRKQSYVVSFTNFAGATDVSYTPLQTCYLEYNVVSTNNVDITVSGAGVTETVSFTSTDTYQKGTHEFTKVEQVEVVGGTVSTLIIYSKDNMGNGIWGLTSLGDSDIRLCSPGNGSFDAPYGTVTGMNYSKVFTLNQSLNQGDLLVVDSKKYKISEVYNLYKKSSYSHTELVVVPASEEDLS